jgi:hypothetical protein
MKEKSLPFKNSKISKMVFISSIIVAAYWLLAKGVNVYSNAIVGAIFEILWLPFISLLFLLPIISLFLLLKDRVNVRSLYLFTMLIGIATIFFMIFSK